MSYELATGSCAHAHPAACLTAWLQVVYRQRIRERYFGRDYEKEVAWVEESGSSSTGRVGGSKVGGARKAVGPPASIVGTAAAKAADADGADQTSRRRYLDVKEE